MDNDAKHLVNAAMSEPWPWRTPTNPLLLAVLLYTIGVAVNGFTTALGLSVLPVIVITAGLGAGVVVRAAMRHVKPVGLVYAIALAAGSIAWVAYASQTPTFDITDMGGTGAHAVILFGAAALLYAVYTWLLIDARRTDDASPAALDPDNPDLYGPLPPPVTPPHPVEAALARVGVKGVSYIGTDTTDDADTHHLLMSADGDLIEEIAPKLRRLELALRAPYKGAISLYEGPDVASAILRVARRDVLAREVDYIDEGTSSVHVPQRVGRSEDGGSLDLPIAGYTGLVYGKRNGGKSTFLLGLVGRLIACVDTIVIVVDPKGAPLIAPWLRPYALGRTSKPVLYMVASTVDEANTIAIALERLGERRTRTLLDEDKVRTHPGRPHVVVVVDETDDITGSNGTAEVRKRMTRVVRKFRAAGIDMILATQRGTSSMTGGRDLTSQAGWTVVMALRDKSELWSAMNRTGVAVDVTRFTHPGTLIAAIDGEASVTMAARSQRFADFDAIAALAEKYTPVRPEPDSDIAEIFAELGITGWWEDTSTTAGSLLARLRGEDVAPVDITHSGPGRRDVPAILRDIAELIGDRDAIGTVELVAGLAGRGYDIDGDATPAQQGFSLRGLLYDELVDMPSERRPASEQLGGQGNPKGYKLSAIDSAIAWYESATADRPAAGDDAGPATPDSDAPAA